MKTPQRDLLRDLAKDVYYLKLGVAFLIGTDIVKFFWKG